MAAIQVQTRGNPIYQCSFSPFDSAVVCVSGKEHFQFFRMMGEDAFRAMPPPRC